ncbi:DUF1028 domain-containing protein [Salarchaeum sp. JOR-1]|uniref:DUF1028 domain-containing protein n=1 Tax=Salarchaeum sp. JOR-1 TaxID=2599399 RepID=UPI0011985889|nr:DUF1028 domain-containing protein [Salarchaeum sp. JOR-1]QDX39940.1 DUF1028 domain-containing protein [Salarchaeum sp. JOR-1]
MTFSICVREEYEDDDGDTQHRFGVAVTTRLPGVGTLCPFVSENGAVATQSLVNVELGRKGVEYLDDGLAVADALDALLNADDGKPERQLHGVDAEGEFAFSGEECGEWFGDLVGENYTVAGNLLTGESVIEETAAAYEGGDREEPLAKRLIDALGAGQAEGGDKRDDLEVQSAAVTVATTEDREFDPYYDDLRVDASTDPVQELRETFRLASEGQETALEKYAEEAENAEETASVESASEDGEA